MIQRKYVNLLSILLVISTCVFVGVKSFYSVKIAQSSNIELAQFQLPLFEKIQSLRSELAMQNLAFHKYYLSNDDEDFSSTFTTHQNAISNLLNHINRDFADSVTLDNMSDEIGKITAISRRMKAVMQGQTDWDGARSVLVELEPTTASINQLMSVLITDIEMKVVAQTKQSLAKIEQSLLWTSFLNGGLLLTLAMLLWLDARRNRDQHEIRRFAGFPQRNPRPVLALTAQGQIAYANPASVALCKTLFDSDKLTFLLPEKIERLIDKCQAESGFIEGEYCLHNSYFDYVLHWLPDLNEFRLYLADISARKRAENNLKRLAYSDELTGLRNKAALNRDFHAESAQFSGFIILIDIINLAQVTLRLGHNATDSAIKLCASHIDEVCKHHSARLYHLNEGQFAIMYDTGERPTLLTLLDALHHAFGTPVNIISLEFFLNLSLGVAKYQKDTSLEKVLKDAHIALRSVSDRGGVLFYSDELASRSKRKIDIEVALRSAISKNQLSLYFQPQINLKTNSIVGAEALLRWQTDDGSWVSPADFIPIAEESALIIEIGNWVLREAIHISAELNNNKGTPFVIAINIAPEQLLSPDFCHNVIALLGEYGTRAECIELEVTESAALYDINLAITVMEQLQAVGIRFALDDFGTGYSSFSYITRLPLNKLKIDQSFIKNMLDDTRLSKVTETIITMANPLSLTVIAEGVELIEQQEILRAWGCDEVQGYHIAKPMPLVQLKDWLSKAL